MASEIKNSESTCIFRNATATVGTEVQRQNDVV